LPNHGLFKNLLSNPKILQKGEVWELATLSFLDSLAFGALVTRRAIVGCQFPDAVSYRKNDCDTFRSHSGT